MTETSHNPASIATRPPEPEPERPVVPPTAEGIERWPKDGYYDGKPCTCTEACDEPCDGKCGCEACDLAYNDYLSSPAYGA